MDLPLVTATPTALPAGRLHPPKPPIEVPWARHADEVLAAQRLRCRVFVEENHDLPLVRPGRETGGARLPSLRRADLTHATR